MNTKISFHIYLASIYQRVMSYQQYVKAHGCECGEIGFEVMVPA